MDAHPVTSPMGLCPIPRPRRHRFPPGIPSDEKGLRKRDVSIRCDGFSEETLKCGGGVRACVRAIGDLSLSSIIVA